MHFFVLLNIKEDTLKNDPTSFWSPLTPIVYLFPTMEVMRARQASDYSIVPNILYGIQQQNESHTGLEQQHNVHFWVNYSFNIAAVTICVNVNQTSERKPLTVLDGITFVK